MQHGSGLRSRTSHSAPAGSYGAAEATSPYSNPYSAPSNPYGGFDSGDNSHLKEVGGFGGYGGGDPAAGFSAYGSGQQKGTPWVKILIGTVVGILLIGGIYYFLAGSSVATPTMTKGTGVKRDTQPPPEPKAESPTPNKGIADQWDEQAHTPGENIAHEEMRGSDGQLSDDLKGLAKKAEMFYELDNNKDAFLAGADVPRGTLNLLDTDGDNALSFKEWTHGFGHLDDSQKLAVFKTFYGQIYGSVLPTTWIDRAHYVGSDPMPADDRAQQHDMDAMADATGSGENPRDVTLDMDPGEMTDEELNAALDQDFTRMDTDTDGIVTLQEYKAWDVGNADVESDYHVLDRNHDGKLTRMELSGNDDHSAYITHDEHEKQHQELHEKHIKTKQEAIEKAQALGSDEALAAKEADDEADDADDDEELEEAQLLAEFERMDLDKDNKVSEDEYVQWAEQANPGDTSARHNFRLIDRNKSKKLTFRELFPTSIRKRDLHYDEAHHDEHAEEPDEDEWRHPDEDEADASAPSEEDEKALIKSKFQAADTNGDFRLSAAESEASGLRDDEGSVPADMNKDGFVDLDEFEQNQRLLKAATA